MTLTIETGTTSYELSTNVVGVPSGNYTLTINSQWSNRPVIQVETDPILTNDRYTKWSFSLTVDEGDKHYNGMGDYIITEDISGDTIVSGSMKLIYSPGGGTGTQAYVSNNENREADVFYRPAY